MPHTEIDLRGYSQRESYGMRGRMHCNGIRLWDAAEGVAVAITRLEPE